jgi:hypothetical protein
LNEVVIMTHTKEEEIARSKFYSLVHHKFGGDLRTVETALSVHPDRRVSVRTIQSWLAKASLTSSRKCPDWAPRLLQTYLDQHPEHVKQGRARIQLDREFAHQKGYGERYADRADSEGNIMAEAHIREKEMLKAKFSEVPVARLPEEIADEFVNLRREIEGLHHALTVLTSALSSADGNTSVLELKKKHDIEMHLLQSGRALVFNTVNDIVQQREEFSIPDGTSPRGK